MLFTTSLRINARICVTCKTKVEDKKLYTFFLLFTRLILMHTLKMAGVVFYGRISSTRL